MQMHFRIMAKRFKVSGSIRIRPDRFQIPDSPFSERNRDAASFGNQMRQHFLLQPAADRDSDRISFHDKLKFRKILLHRPAYREQLIQIRSGRSFDRIGNGRDHFPFSLIWFKSVSGPGFCRFRSHDRHDHAGGCFLHLHGFLAVHDADLICFLV